MEAEMMKRIRGWTTMRLLLISDLHGNIEALGAILKNVSMIILCLGDLVDYGPDPLAIIDWMRITKSRRSGVTMITP